MASDPDFPPRLARRRPPTQSGWGGLLVVLLVGFVLGAVLLWLVGPLLRPGFQAPPRDPEATERPPAPKSPPDSEEEEAIRVFRESRDSVVNVDTVLLVRNRLDMKVQERQTGTGSGFFWDADGRIVTNFHVVREAVQRNLKVRIVTADRSAYDARIVGAAPDYDLAVVQVAAPKDRIKPIKVGTSHDLEVGQKAYAIGNPFGLSQTMTKGIVSALDRQIESLGDRPITGAIQTDAPINPGNSGGPLLDKDGRLIGVNTSIATPSGGNVGIGFAIPVDTVNWVVPELIRNRRVLRPGIGVRLVDQQRLRQAGFPTGVMIQTVLPDGPAAKAGLRGVRVDPQTREVAEPGDLIVAVNGEEVNGLAEFQKILAKYRPGDAVKLTIERGDQRQEVEVTLQGV
jgi:S1-C subfamily serine protease